MSSKELDKSHNETRAIKELLAGMRAIAKAGRDLSGCAIWTNDTGTEIAVETLEKKLDDIWDECNNILFSPVFRNNRPSNPRTS